MFYGTWRASAPCPSVRSSDIPSSFHRCHCLRIICVCVCLCVSAQWALVAWRVVLSLTVFSLLASFQIRPLGTECEKKIYM